MQTRRPTQFWPAGRQRGENYRAARLAARGPPELRDGGKPSGRGAAGAAPKGVGWLVRRARRGTVPAGAAGERPRERGHDHAAPAACDLGPAARGPRAATAEADPAAGRERGAAGSAAATITPCPRARGSRWDGDLEITLPQGARPGARIPTATRPEGTEAAGADRRRLERAGPESQASRLRDARRYDHD